MNQLQNYERKHDIQKIINVSGRDSTGGYAYYKEH